MLKKSKTTQDLANNIDENHIFLLILFFPNFMHSQVKFPALSANITTPHRIKIKELQN